MRRFNIEIYSTTFEVWGARGYIMASSRFSAWVGARFRHPGAQIRLLVHS